MIQHKHPVGETEIRSEKGGTVARAEKTWRLAGKGVGLMTAENFLAGMRERAQSAQQRIRAAISAKNKWPTGWGN
ncbi:MAG TPA: hypothetical protein VF169_11320 [Albitalea sp.]